MKPKHIVARSVTLKDAKGKTRIFMDAGDGDGYATICLFGEGKQSVEIASSRDGGVYISLYGASQKVSAVFSILPDEKAGLQIRDADGRLGTVLGTDLQSGEHHLTVYRNGKVSWTTKGKRKRGGSKQ